MGPDDRRMNRGPEIYDSSDLKVEYSRQERLEMTDFPGKREPRAARRISLRILLLDILLLCIIGGIIYPFIINKNRTGTIDGIFCTLTARTSGDVVLISVSMKNNEPASAQKPFDLELQINGVHEETVSDITPPPGDERTLRFTTGVQDKKISIGTLIRIGDDEITLNTVSASDL